MLRWYNRWLGVLVLVVLMGLGLSIGTAAAQGAARDVEIVGTIQVVTTGGILVNDTVIDITAAEGSANLAAGLEVRVEGFYIGRVVRARQIQITEDRLLPGEVEIIGRLDNLNAFTAVVSGVSFDISRAEVEPGLAVGDRVKVHASLSDSGVWAARQLQAFIPSADTAGARRGDEFEIVGTLQTVGNGFIIVTDRQINIARAEIKNPLVVGTPVKVHVRLINGRLVAREVENAAQDDLDDDGGDDDLNDDNSGHGSDDDNSGHGSDDDDDRDDDDDNSGHGSDDDDDRDDD